MWNEEPESKLCKTVVPYLTTKLINLVFYVEVPKKTSYAFIVLTSHKNSHHIHELRIIATDSFLTLPVKPALILHCLFGVKNSFSRKRNSIPENF